MSKPGFYIWELRDRIRPDNNHPDLGWYTFGLFDDKQTAIDAAKFWKDHEVNVHYQYDIVERFVRSTAPTAEEHGFKE